MSSESDDGYTVAIHRAMTEPMMVGGVPRNYAICCWGLTAALVLGMHNYFMIPVGIALHIVGKLAAKHDPYWMEILPRHLRYKSFYEG